MAGLVESSQEETTSVADAVEGYLAAATLTDSSLRTYATALRALASAYPDAQISTFEPPRGTSELHGFLGAAWGGASPRTWNRSMSVFTSFFGWSIEAGLLAHNPALGIERKLVNAEPREAFSSAEIRAIFESNSDVRDLVPLRLLVEQGIPSGAVQNLRFRDCDPGAREIDFHWRRGDHVVPVDDDRFWDDFANLRRIREATDEDFLMARVTSRLYNPTDAQVASLGPGNVLGHPDVYLVRREDGRWMKVEVNRHQPRTQRSVHNWWYACLARANVVEQGMSRGSPKLMARRAIGQEIFRETGDPRLVRKRLSLRGMRDGTVGLTYTNFDADPLEKAIRRVRRELDQQVRGSVRSRPLKPRTPIQFEPVVTFVYYLVEERDIVELGRVSVEALEIHYASEQPLAPSTAVVRVVPREDLLAVAREETSADHPLLHAHSLVAVWGALEAMAADVSKEWRGHAGPLPPTKRRRVRSSGIERFEKEFDAVGLAGAPEGQLATNLFELEQIRHVHAHKGGRVDQRFASVCPALGYQVGDLILVTREMWHDFVLAMLLYAESVLLRMRRAMGLPPTASVPAPPPVRYPARDLTK